MIKTQVLEELRNTKFPTNSSRTNVARQGQRVEGFALGLAPYRGPSRWNIFRLAKALIAELSLN
jgi:hypothetical protein